MTYGAAIQRLSTPDRHGRLLNVVLGFSTLAAYVDNDEHYFGATIGRYANRIAGARFALDGIDYELVANDGKNSLHGGPAGLDKQVWQPVTASADHDSAQVVFHYTSDDGEMGFPGTLALETTYTLSNDGSLRIAYRASTDRPTVVNLTNHALWNLAGEGPDTIDEHRLTVHATRYTPIGSELIPTGEIAPVAGTPLDFTAPTPIGARLTDINDQLRLAHGYDHNFVLDRDVARGLALAARLEEPRSGRVLEVLTTEPGLQIYSGNFLDGTSLGTSGHPYLQRAGVALETQHFPDSPHHDNFPTTILRPGAVFTSQTAYHFTVDSEPPPKRLTQMRASSARNPRPRNTSA